MATKGEPVLVLDIDSASVGACILETHDEKPILSLSSRMPIGSGSVQDPSSLIPLLKEALTALLPAYAKSYPKLRTVSVVAASPWFAASLRTLASKSEKPVKVSQHTVRRVVQDHRKTEQETADKSTIEALPVTVLVNGYRTLVKSTLHGKSLSVTLYESIADASFIQTVTDAVHASLTRADVTWHTTPLAYAETLLRVSDEDHATVIDVGGEVTDIIILSHQTVAYVGSIPIGSKTIARAVGGGKQDALPDAASRLAMFAKAELSQKEMEGTAASLTKAAKEWQDAFSKILAAAGNTVPVPHRVFVVGERDELSWFTQVVTGVELRGQHALAIAITADFFSGMLSYGEGGMFDASLALDALFFHMRSGGHERAHLTPPVLYSVQ